jgi:hypothetical protein
MSKHRELPAGLPGRYTINDQVYEVSEKGVFLINSNMTDPKILNRQGYVDTSGPYRPKGAVVRDALEAQERWTREQHERTITIKDGWTIRHDHDKLGNVIALSPYKPRSIAYLERDRSGYLRVRVDNQTQTNSKSVPVAVVLALVGRYIDTRGDSERFSDDLRRFNVS